MGCHLRGRMHALEKEMATHSSVIAWRTQGMEEPGRLPSMGSHACVGEGDGNHSSILAWRIPGMEEPGRLPSMGSHRVGHD